MKSTTANRGAFSFLQRCVKLLYQPTKESPPLAIRLTVLHSLPCRLLFRKNRFTPCHTRLRPVSTPKQLRCPPLSH